MKFEGVTFSEFAARQMKKKDFIEAHKNVFWLDREPKVREKMLSDVYDTMCGKANGKDKPEGEEVTE